MNYTSVPPLKDFLLSAIEQNHGMVKEAAEWRYSKMFFFVRIAKTHPDLTGKSAEAALTIVQRELRRARVDADEVFDCVDPWAELLSTWEKILPEGMGPLDLAWELARQRPVTPLHPVSPQYTLFLSVAYHLQDRLGKKEILLPVENMAGLLKVDRRTVSYYRNIAKKQGLLKQVSGHCLKERRASQFFFCVDLFDSTLCQVAQAPASHWHQDIQDTHNNQNIQEKQENTGGESSNFIVEDRKKRLADGHDFDFGWIQ